MHTGDAESGGNFTGAGEKGGSVLGICVDVIVSKESETMQTAAE
ncbi:hypothetical protein [Oribacterium sp. oral taxon 102]|nr:hypothetical protein [Oribacterium sp. oral taxon 102]